MSKARGDGAFANGNRLKKTGAVGLLQPVARRRVRRRSLRSIVRALAAIAGRQEGVAAARHLEAVAGNPIFRRAWERGAGPG